MEKQKKENMISNY